MFQNKYKLIESLKENLGYALESLDYFDSHDCYDDAINFAAESKMYAIMLKKSAELLSDSLGDYIENIKEGDLHE